LIAPTSQLVFGQGDPANWDLAAGLSADPQVIPGALAAGEPSFRAEITPESLTLQRPQASRTYSLLPAGLQVEFQGQDLKPAMIPLVLDPWRRMGPDWGASYQGHASSRELLWGFPEGPAVRLTSSGKIQPVLFTETRALMGSVENPNREVPPGHYLPFPLALVQVFFATDDAHLRIELVLDGGGAT